MQQYPWTCLGVVDGLVPIQTCDEKSNTCTFRKTCPGGGNWCRQKGDKWEKYYFDAKPYTMPCFEGVKERVRERAHASYPNGRPSRPVGDAGLQVAIELTDIISATGRAIIVTAAERSMRRPAPRRASMSVWKEPCQTYSWGLDIPARAMVFPDALMSSMDQSRDDQGMELVWAMARVVDHSLRSALL